MSSAGSPNLHRGFSGCMDFGEVDRRRTRRLAAKLFRIARPVLGIEPRYKNAYVALDASRIGSSQCGPLAHAHPHRAARRALLDKSSAGERYGAVDRIGDRSLGVKTTDLRDTVTPEAVFTSTAPPLDPLCEQLANREPALLGTS
jgi:hypothetical protein